MNNSCNTSSETRHGNRSRLTPGKASTGAASPGRPSPPTRCRTGSDSGVEVNDEQSRLNPTRVRGIVRVASPETIEAVLRRAAREGTAVCVAGGRHSMGGQQFGTNTLLIDTTAMNGIVSFDRERGLIEVEAGIRWPELIAHLVDTQKESPQPWAIRQKQTGVDRVSIGGSLASNIHGRGLRYPPFASDIESFVIVDANGRSRVCSRRENSELFSLAIGGYGLFGIVTRVTLRLIPRRKLQRLVSVISVSDLPSSMANHVRSGCLYGDCQYAIHLDGEPSEHRGVLAAYRPVDPNTPIPGDQVQLSAANWADLYRLARTDKPKAFERYSEYYLSTHGQIYWCDTNQLAGEFEGHKNAVDTARGTEMITEIYVRPDAFASCLGRIRDDFKRNGTDMTYGTIRFIETDNDSFLAWATEPYVCVVCNLHVVHTKSGVAKARMCFRRILDRVIEHGGKYFLTYHRWANRRHVEASYPTFPRFLRLKCKYDPKERFQSDWYRHHKAMFADAL